MSWRVVDRAKETEASLSPRSRSVVTVGLWLVITGAWAVLLTSMLVPGWPHSPPFTTIGPHSTLFLDPSDLRHRISEGLTMLHGQNPFTTSIQFTDNVPPTLSGAYLIFDVVGSTAGIVLSVWLSMAAIAVICGIAWSKVAAVSRCHALVASSVVLVPVIAVLSVPARSAIWYGQDQLWLLALVLVDLFVIPRRWTGILTGLVVSVSFWPAIFVAAIFVRSRWAGVLRSGVGLCVGILAGGLLSWRDTWHYWTVMVPTGQVDKDAVQVFGVRYPSGFAMFPNMSLHGFLARPPLGGVLAGTAAKYLLIVAVVELGLWVAWRLFGRGLPITAVTMVAIAGVDSSPFAWEHHWCWVALLLPFAAWEARASHPVLAIAMGLATVLFVRPFYFAVTKLVPGLGFRHVDLSSPKVIVIGGLFALGGACLLIGGAIAAALGPRGRHASDPPRSSLADQR
jgi:alpha-1,2-mannosyltransferase